MFEGDCVLFNCSFTGSREVPLWSINNTYYDWKNIPQRYNFNLYDFSLKIENVSIEMDNIPFRCAVEGFSSDIGIVILNTMATEFQGSYKIIMTNNIPCS